MLVQAVVRRIEGLERLDSFAAPLADAVRKLIPRGPLKDALSGTWLGHQLHPLLTDIPIGSFTSATILDLVGGRRAQPAAALLSAVGVVSVVPTAAAGFADWSDIDGPDRRVGVVHAAANIVGVGFYTASIAARLRGRRWSAASLGLMGMGAMSIGGYLGGHLTFVRGHGVNRIFMETRSGNWKLATTDELPERSPVVADLDDAPALLYRSEGALYGLSNRCTHAGGPLDEGQFDHSSPVGPCVTCPWHQSTFRLVDGAVVHGPASVPQPSYDVRMTVGGVEARPRDSDATS
jgi:nitrite reductase/ring-hydroxylating ferredoxin subunit/uncharacterized membrane protein